MCFVITCVDEQSHWKRFQVRNNEMSINYERNTYAQQYDNMDKV